MASQSKQTFNSLREALSLPAPERGKNFVEYPHQTFSRFKVRVHPPDLNGRIKRQWAIRAKFTVGGKEKEDRDTYGLLEAVDKTETSVDYKTALRLVLQRLTDIEELKTSPELADEVAKAAKRMTMGDAWARHDVETRTQRRPTTDKEVSGWNVYFKHLKERFIDELDYSFWSSFVHGLGNAKLLNADGLTWSKLPTKREESTIIGAMNLAGKLFSIAHRYDGLPNSPKDWNPPLEAKRKLVGSPNKRTGYIKLTKIAAVWHAADVLCASWARDQLRIYLLTALRHSLLAELQFSEVDFAARVLRISPHKKGTKRRGAKTRGNAPDLVIPVSKTVLEILEARRKWAPDRNGPVWWSTKQPGGKSAKKGAPRVPRHSDPRTNWAHIVRLVLDGVKFMRHDLRRTFASVAIKAGADLMGTSLLMLHSPRTVAKVLGLPDVTLDYMNTNEARQQMRSASNAIEKYVLGMLDGSIIPDEGDEIELPPLLAEAVNDGEGDEDDE